MLLDLSMDFYILEYENEHIIYYLYVFVINLVIQIIIFLYHIFLYYMARCLIALMFYFMNYVYIRHVIF